MPAIWLFPQLADPDRYAEAFRMEIFFCIVDLRMGFDDAISTPISWRRYLVSKKSEINEKEKKELEEIGRKIKSISPRVRFR